MGEQNIHLSYVCRNLDSLILKTAQENENVGEDKTPAPETLNNALKSSLTECFYALSRKRVIWTKVAVEMFVLIFPNEMQT